MKTLAVFGLVFLTSGVVLAQRSPRVGFGNVTFPNNTGFGSVVFPGTGRPPISGVKAPLVPPTFPAALGTNLVGAPISGFGRNGRFGGNGGFGGFGGGYGVGGGIVPYPYPVYMGGYGYPDVPQQPNVTVVYPPPSPPVVLNQTFASDAGGQIASAARAGAQTDVQLYQAPSRTSAETAAAAAQSEAPYYLIALKDHSIYSAVGYWVSGDTLHYITSGNNHNEVSLSLVDRKLTVELNRDHHTNVALP